MRSIAAGGCQTFFVFMERMIPDLNHVRRRNELRSFIKFQGIQSNAYFLLIFASLIIKRYRFFSLPLVTPNVFYVLSLAWSQTKSKTLNNNFYKPYRLHLFCLECWHEKQKVSRYSRSGILFYSR